MSKIVGLESIKSGGELQQELQQGGKDVTNEVMASILSSMQKT